MRINRIIIFGATGGIGLNITSFLFKKGNTVYGVGRKNKPLTLPEDVGYYRARAFSSRKIEKILDEISFNETKTLTIINATGRCFYGHFSNSTYIDFFKIIRDNLFTTFKILKAVTNFSNRVKIKINYIDIGSQAGIKSGHSKFSLYSMVKSAVRGLLYSLSSEFEDIVFVSMNPHGIDTKIYKKSLGNQIDLEEKFKKEKLISPDELSKKIKILVEKINENRSLFVGSLSNL